MTGISRGPEDRVWTFTNVARRDWKDAWGHVPPDFSGPLSHRGVPRPEELWYTIVEVLEPDSRRVFARGELDDVVLSVLDNRTLAVFRETEEGVPYIAVLKLTLDSGGPGQDHSK
jgi:hypothetical protein